MSVLAWNKERALRTFEACDPAGLVGPGLLGAFATAVAEPGPVTVYFAHPCPRCGEKLGKKCEREAAVVTCSGVVRSIHVSQRCGKRGCELYLKQVWSNFVSREKEHEWLDGPSGLWPSNEEDICMISPQFGVTRSWHSQFCRRMLKQHASWTSESQILGLDKFFPKAAPGMLEDAWLKLQLKKRWHEVGKGPFLLSQAFTRTFGQCI